MAQADSADSLGSLGNGVDFDSLINGSQNAEIRFLLQCKRSGVLYQNQFRQTWNEVEKQIRCVRPAEWSKKEDWQSKVYIPVQNKNSEVAVSQMNDILFGTGRFFECVTDDDSQSSDADQLSDLIDILINRSGFDVQNSFVMQEGCDFGTSFIKILMKPNGQGIQVIWRSTYQILIDPNCGHDMDKARFWIDVYEKDINYLIEEARNPKSMYKKDVIEAFLKDAETEAKNFTSQRASQAANTTDGAKQLMEIRSIDGTQFIPIPAAYATVDISEYWVKVPQTDGTFADKKITLLNNKYELCNEANEYGFLPSQWCRVKKRKYDLYGRGYLENVRGLQDLMNSGVNLGFDSMKINSMDIILIDENKVKDINSIKYKPLAVWKMKDINGAKIQRNPASAITDVLRGAQMIDQMIQEATGILKAAEGATQLGGGQTDTTLGEYKLKAVAIDKRFLDQARFIESDYLVNLLHKIYMIILNPKLFTQAMVNNFLGMDEVDDLSGAVQPLGTVDIQKKKMVPKLDLAKVREESKKGKYRFRCIGATRFTQIQQRIQKYETVLKQVVASPALQAITNIPELWKRTLSAIEMDNVDELINKAPSSPGTVPGGPTAGGGTPAAGPGGAPGMPSAAPPIGGGR